MAKRIQRFREWRCERFGHKRRDIVRRGYRKDKWPVVATAIMEESSRCKRCGLLLMAPRVTDLHGIHSLTLSSPWMDTFDRDGIVWTEQS